MAFQRRKPAAIGVKAPPYPGIETAFCLGIQLAELFKLEHFRASLLHNAAEHYICSGGVVVFWNGRASSVFRIGASRPFDMRDPGEVVEHIRDGSEIEIAERTSLTESEGRGPPVSRINYFADSRLAPRC
jgi:hypothetical protein